MLMQPHLFPGAPYLEWGFFSKYFGKGFANDSSICAFGFEPNPRHRRRLVELRTRLRKAGAPVHIFFGAASDVDGIASFGMADVLHHGTFLLPFFIRPHSLKPFV